MSTLEAVREMLCQAAEATPSEVLKSAQDELVRLSHLVENAKNVIQCNGARKKLTELEPLMPAMEIEVGLIQLEKVVDQGKSAAHRAAARIQLQKLAGQITGLAASEEKEFFQQWLADLNPSLASIPPGSASAEPASVVTAANPAPPPTPDPTPEIQAVLKSLEVRAKVRPIADPAGLVREVDALARRSAALGPGEIRTKLEASINSLTTALKLDEELRRLSETVGALEQAATRADTNLSALSTEHDQIASRIARLGAMPELDTLKQKVGGVASLLAWRREVTEIETELERCAVRIQKNPTDKAVDSGLTALSGRIVQLQDADARASFAQRVESLRKAMGQRREEEKISEALAEIRQKCQAPDASAAAIRSAFNEIANQVNGLPTGQVRSDFEKRGLECRDLIASLEEKPTRARKALQPAVVLLLEPIKGRAAVTARPLVFVARDRFSIGRKPENEPPRADLLTPSSELRISRVHVTFFSRQRQIHVLAGEEGKPSTNPALIDQTPLSATPVAMSFENERRIDLTGVFALQAKLMPSSTPFGPPFAHDAGSSRNTTIIVPPIAGALRVRPQGEDRLPVAAVWLFTDATIGTNSDCAITVPQSGMAPEQARIHFWRKSFWIEVLRSGSLVQLAGESLIPGASQPLLSGQELRLGNFIYKIQLF